MLQIAKITGGDCCTAEKYVADQKAISKRSDIVESCFTMVTPSYYKSADQKSFSQQQTEVGKSWKMCKARYLTSIEGQTQRQLC